MGTPLPEIAKRVKEARECASLTQQELAAQTGYSIRAFGAIERGEITSPGFGLIVAISKATQKSLYFFAAAYQDSDSDASVNPPIIPRPSLAPAEAQAKALPVGSR
jgi:transcriptional regulator with XRE-family HTH domain